MKSEFSRESTGFHIVDKKTKRDSEWDMCLRKNMGLKNKLKTKF